MTVPITFYGKVDRYLYLTNYFLDERTNETLKSYYQYTYMLTVKMLQLPSNVIIHDQWV